MNILCLQSNSSIATSINASNNHLVANNIVNDTSEITDVKLALIQWQNSTVLQHGGMTGSKIYGSMADIGMEFIKKPELNHSGTGLELDLSVSE